LEVFGLLFWLRIFVSGASCDQLPRPKAPGRIPSLIGAEDAHELETPEDGFKSQLPSSQKDILRGGKSIFSIHVIEV